MECSTALLRLQRIAHTLGVSADVFYSAADDSKNFNGDFRCAQTLELLDLFSKIADPKIRQACLAYVRDAAEGTGRTEG